MTPAQYGALLACLDVERAQDKTASIHGISAMEAPMTTDRNKEAAPAPVGAPTRQEREHQLWEQWKEQGKPPELTTALLRSFAPLANRKMREWRPPSVPESAFRAEFDTHLLKAFDSFNPNRGASLSTHVNTRVKKVLRTMNERANVGYIPENKARQIGPIMRAENELTDTLGRTPTNDELADHLGMPLAHVNQIQRSRRRDVPSSMFETSPIGTVVSRDAEVLALLPMELNPKETEVFEHMYGKNGRKVTTSTNDIARLTGQSAPQVSRLRTSILEKFKRFR